MRRLGAVVAVVAALAAPAAGGERRAALDGLLATQRPYGGWVFASTPGGRPAPYTEIMQVAERVAAPLGLATWDLLVLRSPGTPAAALELLAGDGGADDRRRLAAAARAGDLLVTTQLAAGGWFSEMPIEGGSLPWWFRRLAWRDTLDDDVTPGAVRVLLALWRRTHEERYRVAAGRGLDLLLDAQHAGGGFPIVWRPRWLRRLHASAEDDPSLNDGATPLAIDTLLDAARTLSDPRYLEAARRGGEWLLTVQRPAPAEGWAQQYDDAGAPAPARRFEPAALATWETRHAIETLLALAQATRETRYCAAAARGVRWLVSARLAAACWPRYRDLASGEPVWMNAAGTRVEDVAAARPGYSWRGGFGIPSLLARLGLDAAGRRIGPPGAAPAPLPGDPGRCPDEGGGPPLDGARLLVATAARARPVVLRGASFCRAAFD